MSCVAALVHDTVIWMAGDSAGTDEEGRKESYSNQKVFARRDLKGTLWQMGGSGGFRSLNLAQYVLNLPSYKGNGEGFTCFLVKEFVPDWRRCLRENGAMAEMQDTRLEKAPGDLIIGINGGIAIVDEYFQVLVPHNPYTAIGSGWDAALGSLNSTKNLMDPEKRIITALEQAQELNANVSDPFLIMNSREAEASVRYVRSVRQKRKR